MEAKVGLLLFARGNTYLDHTILLCKREDYFFEIPCRTLPNDKDGISIACSLMEQCTGFTAGWVDFIPRLNGVFDDPNRNPECRELLITYILFVPTKLPAGEKYEWVKISDLQYKKTYLDTEHVIRYSILGGQNVV